jgi:hypothetical protein
VKARVGNGQGQVRQSTRFLDRAKMEAAIGDTISVNRNRINSWLATNPDAGRNMPPITHSPNMGNLGEGYRLNPNTNVVEKINNPLTDIRVILKSDGNGGYIIQTSYP